VTVLYGGVDAFNNLLGDLWEWDGQDWSQRTVAGGPGLRGATAMAFDPAHGGLLMFGGNAALGTLDDTWLWNGQSWTQLFPATPPYVRVQHCMVTDAARSRVVLLGGGPTPDPFAWEWDGVNWHCQLMSSPSPRAGQVLAYDSVRHVVLLFGGAVFSTSTSFGDTWTYGTDTPASFTAYGSGCAGSLGTPALAAAPYSLPWLGDTFRTRVDAVPAGSGAVFFTGWGATPGLNLAPFGFVGCRSFVTLDSAAFLAGAAGFAEWSIQIPVDPVFANVVFHQQALVFDLGAVGGGAVSNAGTVVIGVR